MRRGLNRMHALHKIISLGSRSFGLTGPKIYPLHCRTVTASG